jgi:tetratricopeptide (TPR) repeat protein
LIYAILYTPKKNKEMKTRNLLVLLFSLVMLTNCFAQKKNKKEKKDQKAETEITATAEETAAAETTVEEAPVVTEQCLVNLSLFNESAKNQQYADALGPWEKVYNECPNANKVIYSRGRDILAWQLTQAKDDVDYEKTFNKLMKLYDDRIKYFGDDSRYPTPWILGNKGIEYVALNKKDKLNKPAYKWLEQSIDGLGENCDIEVMRVFIITSDGIYKAEPTHAEKYIADYVKINSLLSAISSNPDNSNAAAASQLSDGVDNLFVMSGAASCEVLDATYKDKIGQNLNNEKYLNNIVNFYKRVRCTSSEVYFKAAVAVHKINPTSGSANGCAEMSYKAGDHQKAVSFYDEAIKLSTDNMEKADYLYKIAQINYTEFNNYPRAREYARKSLEYNGNNGSAYLLIGIMYAKSKSSFDDPVLGKAVYWVAVDKFNKAKQVDPSVADDANKLIRTYAEYFPSKDDVFFKPEFQTGKSYFVGGWIGESTTCR